MTDFPDYMIRDIPGQTTDIAPQYQTLFALSDECSVPNNSYTYWTYDFPDDGYVYKMDMMYLVIEADVNFTAKCELNGIEFAIDSRNRTIYFPFWANPALVGCYNDQLKIRFWQGSGSAHTVLIRINGIKYKLPTDPYKIPAVDFSGTPRSGSVPLTVVFTDASRQFPTAWEWLFGDNPMLLHEPEVQGTGNPANADHVFTAINMEGLTKANGTLIIDLKASNPSILSNSNSIELTSSGLADSEEWSIPAPLDQDITTDWKTFRLPLVDAITTGGGLVVTRINFIRWYNFTTNGNVTIYWRNARVENADQLPQSTIQNPSHQYKNTGVYGVTLTASNAVGSNYSTKYEYITVS